MSDEDARLTDRLRRRDERIAELEAEVERLRRIASDPNYSDEYVGNLCRAVLVHDSAMSTTHDKNP